MFSGASRKGRVLLEIELERLGIRASHARPYHPQTCGKVERFHQSQKRFLGSQAPAQSVAHLQLQLETFGAYYNQQRPHRALAGRTPLVAWSARLKARPQGPAAAVHYRVRQDRVGSNGTVTLRYQSKLRHIPVGSAHKHQSVRLLIAGAKCADRPRRRVALARAHDRPAFRLPAAKVVRDDVRQVFAMTRDTTRVARMGFEPMTSSLKGKRSREAA